MNPFYLMPRCAPMSGIRYDVQLALGQALIVRCVAHSLDFVPIRIADVGSIVTLAIVRTWSCPAAVLDRRGSLGRSKGPKYSLTPAC